MTPHTEEFTTSERHWKHRIAGMLFPRYSDLLHRVNLNARLAQWLKANAMQVFQSRSEYFAALDRGNDAIDYLEFGVFQGASIKAWAALNQHPDSRFFGFDSFEGLPESWGSVGKGFFDLAGQIPQVDDGRVSFVKGWFQDSLPRFLTTFKPRGRLVVHIDADLYSSTLYCLTKLDAFLVKGSLVLFDELYSAAHEFRAMLDYTAAYGRTLQPIARVADPAGRVAFIVR